MEKQTAVDFLVNDIQQALDIFLPGAILDDIMVQKAKAIEKEQIINAYKHELDDSEGAKILAEQYYNENYISGKSSVKSSWKIFKSK